MPRYEFSEGSSNKFWQIDLKGKSFTTTYGKIGTSGQTSLKEWKDAAEAKKEYDKLVAEKTKKGYELVGGGGGSSADDDDEEEEDEEEAPPPKKAAAKAAPAKAAPAKAAPAKAAPKSNGGTPPRYFEFVEGSSSKFWEITMTGSAVKTRYGKIGTDGQNTLKEFSDAAGAQKEYDKLVKEKTKKGYEEK
jgi:predicted DNA-binding WGR domain protein